MRQIMAKATSVRFYVSVFIVAGVVIVDQWLKAWVKTSMYLYENIHIFDWFYLFFTENKGMAFGWNLLGTMFLASFRVIAVCLLGYYLFYIIRKHYPIGYIVCISLVFAGAIGNVIDNALYGMIYSESTPYSKSVMVPWGEGYAGFLQGHVVDMFYFPIIETDWPEWVPFVGGEHFIFFSPIFNFANASISCGGIALLLFFHRFLTSRYESKISVK